MKTGSPGSGVQSDRDLLAFPGAHVIQEEDVFPYNLLSSMPLPEKRRAGISIRFQYIN